MGISHAECPTFALTLKSIFNGKSKFDEEKFKRFKIEFQSQILNNERPSIFPESLEARAALLDSFMGKQNFTDLSIEEMMKSASKKELKDLVKNIKDLTSSKIKTAFKTNLQMDRLYLRNISKNFPGFFDRVSPEVVQEQLKIIIESKLAKENVVQAFKEMGLIKDPNLFNRFVQSIYHDTEIYQGVVIPSEWMKIAMEKGVDHAWNQGLEKMMINRYSSSLERSLIYEKTLGSFVNTLNKLLLGYGIYQSGEMSIEQIKKIMFFRDVDQFEKNQKIPTAAEVESLPQKIDQSLQQKLWQSWVDTHPEDSQNPASKKYQAAHRQIFNE